VTSTATRPRLFALAALGIVSVCVLITRSALFARNADVAAWGVTFDLTLTIPLVYWAIVVRTGNAKPITIAPVFVAGMTVAALVVPRGQQQFLHDLRFISVPLELVTLALVGRRVLRGGNVFGGGRLAAIVNSEVAILGYALFAWRTPSRRVDKSGWGSIVVCFLVLIGFESIGVHLLVAHWSAKAAWIVTALDLYGMLWLIGDYHALRLLPTFIAGGVLHVRHGLRWSVDVPLTNIAAIEDAPAEWKRKGVLKLTLLDDPRYLVRLAEPVAATGLMGIRRMIDTIAVNPDDAEALAAARGA
jgi:hypothetical protein